MPSTTQAHVLRKPLVSSKASLAARTKDPRLCGADLYVARLGPANKPATRTNDINVPTVSTTSPQFTPPPRSSSPGSLHEELSCCSISSPAQSTHSETSPEDKESPPEIRSSRPCYRCITYIHAVGIKRVFWTNDAGGWDSAKVRDLVDGFEGCGEGGSADMGAFVTKHEVLMMLRGMGGVQG